MVLEFGIGAIGPLASLSGRNWGLAVISSREKHLPPADFKGSAAKGPSLGHKDAGIIITVDNYQ